MENVSDKLKDLFNYKGSKLPEYIEEKHFDFYAEQESVQIIFPYQGKIFFYGVINHFIDQENFLKNNEISIAASIKLNEVLLNMNVRIEVDKINDFIKGDFNFVKIISYQEYGWKKILLYDNYGLNIAKGMVFKCSLKKNKIFELKKYECECGNVFEEKVGVEPICKNCEAGYNTEDQELNNRDDLYSRFKAIKIKEMSKEDKSKRYAINYKKGIKNKMFLDDII